MARVLHNGRDPEAEMFRLKSRSQAVSRRLDRPISFRRLDRWASVAALTVMGAGALYWGLVVLSPWPPMMMLKHIASFPNCDAARAVGLAPARKGEPGYWPSHDADQDGIACEPWRRGAAGTV
jgi:hypothetical protein